MKTAKQLIDLIEKSKEQGTKPFDTQAEVVRVDGDTLWCHFLGGIDETPVEKTISASVGDTVQVRVSGGRAWVTGNQSAPPTDDKEVIRVEKKVDNSVKQLIETTDNLQSQINGISGDENQYFWHQESGSDTGSHITEIPKDDFITNPRGFNILIRSIGFAIRNAMNELAQFTSTLIRLGQTSGSHVDIDLNTGVQMYDENSVKRVELASTGLSFHPADSTVFAEAGFSAGEGEGEVTIYTYDVGAEHTVDISPDSILIDSRDSGGNVNAGMSARSGNARVDVNNAQSVTTIENNHLNVYALDSGLSRTSGVDVSSSGNIHLQGNPHLGTSATRIYFNGGWYDTLKSNPPKIESRLVDDNTSQFIINPTGNLIMGGGEYANSRYNLDLGGSTTENAYLGADSNVFIETNGNTIANRKTWQFTTGGNIVALASSQGIYGVDSTGFSYPYARDNGSNLWMGATQTAAQHHRGRTFISSGYNGTSGNSSIYVSVPNASNNNATNYLVYHEGNIWDSNAYYEGQANATTSLPADTITKVALTELYSGGNTNNKYFEISSGGIKVKTAGRYRLSASAYVSGTGGHGVYVFQGTGTTIATSTEIMGCFLSTTITGGISVAPKVIEANANDIFLLGARSVGGGNCSKHNGTYLLIEKLS